MSPPSLSLMLMKTWIASCVALALHGCSPATGQTPVPDPSLLANAPELGERVRKTDEQWRSQLSEQQYRVLREAGTERAYSGALYDHHDEGVYRCAGCGAPLYGSEDKFDSGTGWPSFTQAIEPGRVSEEIDGSLGMVRTEILCSSCGGHLGHVFDDGPAPTGERHCVNSLSLVFEQTARGPGAPTEHPDED